MTIRAKVAGRPAHRSGGSRRTLQGRRTASQEPTIDLAEYARLGHLGPFDLLGASRARRLGSDLESAARKVRGLLAEDHEGQNRNRYWRDLGNTAFVWFKSLHFHVTLAREIATLPPLTRVASKLLGVRDMLLWGVELVRQDPGSSHRWHTDIECERHGLTIWLPLKNAGPRSGIKLMDGSHRLSVYPQQLKVEHHVDLEDDARVLAAARFAVPEASITIPPAEAGQFVVFAGPLWHASFNDTATTRSALVIQYSSADARVRIPKRWEPPLEWHHWVPPVLNVRCAQP